MGYLWNGTGIDLTMANHHHHDTGCRLDQIARSLFLFSSPFLVFIGDRDLAFMYEFDEQ